MGGEDAWHSKRAKEVLSDMHSSATGISSADVSSLRQEYGPNEIADAKHVSAWSVFFRQFTSPLVYVLLLAGALAFVLKDTVEAYTIFAIILLNAVLGFIQEYRAQAAIAALKQLSAPQARVLRGDTVVEIPAQEVVPGDILLLEAGDIVAADARVLESESMQVDESMLTGESVPSEKVVEKLAENTRVADRENMVYSGTNITYGSGRAVVVAIGAKTEFGKIADHLHQQEATQTPLQKKFAVLAKQIGIGAGVLLFIVFIIGYISNQVPFLELIKLVLILAVATVPSALPLILTISLSLGTKRLAQKKLLVKRLPAAEALGSTTVICTDKTGTLTQNAMTVTQLYVQNTSLSVSGTGYSSEGSVEGITKKNSESVNLLTKIGVTCNEASLTDKETIIGDPTEGSLLVLAKKIDVTADKIVKKYPFDSQRKRMSVYADGQIYTKGAPDELLSVCSHILEDGKKKKLTKAKIKELLKQNDEYASQALRVLGFAYKSVKSAPKSASAAEKGLVFVGLAGMIDPPREEVKDALATCKQAGIRVMMITGDHPTTANAIAKGIGFPEGTVLTGAQLEKISDAELAKQIKDIVIVARAMPEQKVRLVHALQEAGEVVAMTGDGVNDAPALHKADIGIAMGVTGTEVAKEVADAILVDDNFANIVLAVEEGRGIYEKILKSAKYLLSSNAGEIASIFIAVLLGLPWPLIALQILLINVLTDTFPALGLGSDTPEPGLMDKPPRSPKEHPLSVAIVVGIITFGLWIGISTVTGFWLFSDNLTLARSTAFATLVFMQLAAVQSYRSEKFSARRLNPFSNFTVLASICAAAICVLAVLSIPFLQEIFSTTMLGIVQWQFVLGAVIAGIIVIELSKLLGRQIQSTFTSK